VYFRLYFQSSSTFPDSKFSNRRSLSTTNRAKNQTEKIPPESPQYDRPILKSRPRSPFSVLGRSPSTLIRKLKGVLSQNNIHQIDNKSIINNNNNTSGDFRQQHSTPKSSSNRSNSSLAKSSDYNNHFYSYDHSDRQDRSISCDRQNKSINYPPSSLSPRVRSIDKNNYYSYEYVRHASLSSLSPTVFGDLLSDKASIDNRSIMTSPTKKSPAKSEALDQIKIQLVNRFFCRINFKFDKGKNFVVIIKIRKFQIT